MASYIYMQKLNEILLFKLFLPYSIEKEKMETEHKFSIPGSLRSP